MRASILIALTSATALAAGVAFAQDTAVNPPVAAPAPAADSSAGLPQAYASSDTLGDATKLKAGDPNVVSNGPVPDTRENRKTYGRPLSHAGRITAPAGN